MAMLDNPISEVPHEPPQYTYRVPTTVSLSEGELVVTVNPQENGNTDKLSLEEFKAKIFYIIAVKTTVSAVLACLITILMTHLIPDGSRFILLLLSFAVHGVLFFTSACNELRPKMAYICLGISAIAVALIVANLSVRNDDFLGDNDTVNRNWNPYETVLTISTLSLLLWKAQTCGASKTVRRLTHMLFLIGLINYFVSEVSSFSFATSSFVVFPRFQVFGQFSFMMMSLLIENMTEESDDLSADRCPSQALFYFLLGLYALCGGCGIRITLNSFKC